MDDTHHEKHKIYYVCEGTCGGKVIEEEWKGGKKTCGTVGCPDYGKALRRKEWCDACGRWCE